MEDNTNLLNIFLNLPNREALETYLKSLARGEPNGHYLRFRYGVSPATLVHDLVFNWNQTGRRGGWSAKVKNLAVHSDAWTEVVPPHIRSVVNAPARELQLSKLLPQEYLSRTNKVVREQYTVREIWKIELMASVIVSHWRTDGRPLCPSAGAECLCDTVSSTTRQASLKKCQGSISRVVLDFLRQCPLSRTTDGNNLRRETFLGLPLGISTKDYVEHAAQQGMHILVPVNPIALVDWEERRFAETFDVLRECFLTRTTMNPTKVVYVLRPEHSYKTKNLKDWLVGEGHYRVQMERLLREDSSIARKIVWFVSDDRPQTEEHVSTLFPDPVPTPWKQELDLFFSVRRRGEPEFRSAYSNSIYTATVLRDQSDAGGGKPIGSQNSRIGFAVSPISEMRFGGLYKTPVIPLGKVNEDSAIRALIADFVSKAIDDEPRNTVVGWKKLTLHQFLSLPGDRN